MPKGSQGQKRPADVIGPAAMVAKIATGEIKGKLKEPLGKVRSGKAGANARAEMMMAAEWAAVAKKPAAKRCGT
jgi:hypothetical protein